MLSVIECEYARHSAHIQECSVLRNVSICGIPHTFRNAQCDEIMNTVHTQTTYSLHSLHREIEYMRSAALRVREAARTRERSERVSVATVRGSAKDGK